METYICLLRGINVSGQKKIKMADLKVLYENLGLQNVQTYIQSGNLIFNCDKTEKAILKNKIKSKIKKHYGFDVSLILVQVKELSLVFENNPFVINRNEDISKLYVTFLEKEPENQDVFKLSDTESGDDEFIVDGKVIYVFCPSGAGRTKFNNNFFEKKLKTIATTRNWKTIGKLVDLTK